MGLTRRDFLRTGALSGVAVAATASSISCVPSGGDANDSGRASSKTQGAAYDIPAFELEEKTFVDLQDGMESGAWTARSIVEAYLGRIDALDQDGPRLNQVLETNPDALKIADQLDAERKAGKLRGPLHGAGVGDVLTHG